MQGIEQYVSRAGITCLRIHYTADPERNPATVAGSKWLAEAVRGIPGGFNSIAWRQEQEIDWEAAGGELVFPQLQVYRERIVVPPFDIPESWDVYASYDYGIRNPSAFHIHAVDHDSCIWTVWEMYVVGTGYRDQARHIRGCAYYDRLAYPPVADPSIWANTQQQSDNAFKSVAQLFAELPVGEQVIFAPGKSGGDITAVERISGDLWRDGENPKWRIFATCPKLIWELQKLRYQEWAAGQAETHGMKEQLVDKDNHAWDGFKMFVNFFFSGPARPVDDKLEGLKHVDRASYDEWKNVEKLYQRQDKSGVMGQWD